MKNEIRFRNSMSYTINHRIDYASKTLDTVCSLSLISHCIVLNKNILSNINRQVAASLEDREVLLLSPGLGNMRRNKKHFIIIDF